MTETTPAFSYEPFSREPEYIDVNRQFVTSLPLDGCRRVLDLACGTGTVTAMLMEATRSAGWIVGLDTCREALLQAQTFVAEGGFSGDSLLWLEGSADQLPIGTGTVDAVVMGNAIQMLADKRGLAAEVARVLPPGGFFAFNTSFYAGTYLPETEHFYLRWVQESLEYIRRKDEALRSAGQPGFSRKKSYLHPAFSNPWLSRGEYEAVLIECGFRVASVAERTVLLTQQSFEAIGAYAGLASVLLRGYPVNLACEALVNSAGPAMTAEKWSAVPRLWIEFIAVKN